MDLQQCHNPLFAREKVQDLDGEWLFSFDNVVWQTIRVPFCPQSDLSGIGRKDFFDCCYYKRSFTVNCDGNLAILHFGAVDYFAEVYVNAKFVCSHTGGFTPFEADITKFCRDGENELYILVRDCNRDIPFGKQSWKENSFGCFYTRTTGIWQSVWIEYAPEKRVKEFYFTPNVGNRSVTVDLITTDEGSYKIDVFLHDNLVGSAGGTMSFRENIVVPLDEEALWEAGKGELYEVKITFCSDEVYSYFGLREVKYDGYKFLLNGKEIFQKLVLDQGYYPDGIYTAPNVEAMQNDIRIASELGFNGARLHQKVFDPKFLYLCDKAGYMVWGEFPSWGVDFSTMQFAGRFLTEWQEAIKRDFNHPCIVTWCPLNEVWGDWENPKKKRDVRFVDTVYEFTKKLDPTRPCIDVSGGHHGHKTDLFDFHCYEPIEKIKQYLTELEEKDKIDVPLLYCEGDDEPRFSGGVAVNFSECGGISFGQSTLRQSEVNECVVQSTESWGYGNGENNGDGFIRRYEELMAAIFSSRKISGFCYTQLYDIEQEQNGFYKYDRSDKLTEKQKAEIRRINSRR